MNERFKGGGEEGRSTQSRRKPDELAPATFQEGKLTPEQRTEAFFSQDVKLLTVAMRGRIIASQEDGKMIRVDNPEGWSSDRVGDRYSKGHGLRLTELVAGALGIFPLPVRRMRQSLISANSGEELGGCVRLVRASRFDNDTEEFVPMPREGDIANHFEFDDNQAVRLKFLDDSEVLYFNKGEDNGVRVDVPGPLPEQAGTEKANQYLRDLVGQ